MRPSHIVLFAGLALAGLSSAGQPASVHFSTHRFSAFESSGAATVTIFRTCNLSSTSTIEFSTAERTARAGTDYSSVSRWIVFPPGAARAEVIVPLFDDPLVNGDRFMLLRLQNPSAGTELAAAAESVLRIQDNERPVIRDRDFGSGNSRLGDNAALQADGKIVVAGDNGFVRLEQNGAVDPEKGT